VAEGRRGITRRGLLRVGGAGAGLTVLGATGLGPVGAPAAAAQASRGRPNVLLIAVDGVRADFIGAYDDADPRADTPNLDKLAAEALRFEQAVPDSMPAFPSHRSLVTGVRSFPFRDWTRTAGMPPYPGWNFIRSYQPSLPGVLEGTDVTTLWIADSPVLEESRFENVHRSPAGGTPGTPQVKRFLSSVVPGGVDRTGPPPVKRTVDAGVRALDQLKARQPFFLAVDAFDRAEANDPTPLYVRKPRPLAEQTGAGELGTTASARYRPDVGVSGDVDTGKVRDDYAAELSLVDAEIGRLLDKLASTGLKDDTVVIFVSPSSLSLGEHGVYGSGPAAGHHDAYRIAYMIRDVDGRRRGEPSQYFASTCDIATTTLSYLGVRAPGRMEGEDLTALLDEEDPGPRPYWTAGVGDKVLCGDGRYVMVSDFEGQEKRIYDSDFDQWADDHGGDDDYVERSPDRDVSREETWRNKRMFHEAMVAGGGVLPRFGPNSPIRPPEEADDDDNETDEGVLDRDDDLNFSGQ